MEEETCDHCGKPLVYDGKNYHSKSCESSFCNAIEFVILQEIMKEVGIIEDSSEEESD